MNKKTGLDFANAALKKRPEKWVVHQCSMCGYPCGYVFSPDFISVGYDSGCDCTGYKCINECEWYKLADHYNMQTNEEYIKKMNDFWGFES